MKGIEPELWKKREQKESDAARREQEAARQNQIRDCAARQKRER
jgi:hypothetical protein